MKNEEALKTLLERVSPRHQALGFLINSTLDHLVATKGKDVADEVQARVLRKRPSSLLKQPAHDVFKVMFASAEVLQPDDLNRGLEEVGYVMCAEFFRTPAGKMLLSVVGKKDPSRLFANAPTAYATVFSWGKRVFKKTGPQSMELRHSEDFLPVPLNVGIQTSAMHIIEMQGAKVTGTSTGLDAGHYVISW